MTQLLNRTHYSVLRAFNKPHQLAAAAKQRGLTHLGLCDFGTLSASVEFVEACQKENIIPILGCDLDTDLTAVEARVTEAEANIDDLSLNIGV